MADDPNARPSLFSPETHDLVAKMLKSPEHSKKFLRILKEANPDAAIPLVDLETTIEAVKADAAKQVGAATNEVNKLRAELTIKEKRGWLTSQGLDEKDVDAVEKLMQEKGITDYEIAANAFRYSRQLASPTPAIPQRKPITEGIPKEALDAAAQGDNSAISQWARSGAQEDIAALQRAAQR